MNAFSRKPTGVTQDMEAFIEGAEKRTEKPAPAAQTVPQPVTPQELPWEMPGIREDLLKTFNLRLSEPYHLKLAYIAEHTPHSMHNFCIDVLTGAIDAKIEELTGKA